MKRILQHLKSLQNSRGNILVSAFLSLVILSFAVGGIAQLTVAQFNTTKQKIDAVNTDMLGEALLEQAVYDFEKYLNDNNFDFAGYMANMTTSGVTDYGIIVNHMSGLVDEYTGIDFTDYDGENNLAYRFTYSYNNDTSRMIMYSYITNSISYAEPVDPFDFQMATNGSLIFNGGYFRKPQIFGRDIIWTNVSPYLNRSSGNQDQTPNASEYPAFNGNGTASTIYYGNSFNYCEPNCYDTTGLSSEPFVIETSEFLNVIGNEANLDFINSGDINPDKIISDFFGSFSLNDRIIEYVQDNGPTESRVVTDGMLLSTIGSTIWNDNSGIPVETCEIVKIKGKDTEVCTYEPSTEPYTRLNAVTSFDPANSVTDLDYAGIYQGNLTISENFTITNTAADATTETIIVDGDLIIDNSGDVDISGFFVVLGDLYFQGDSLTVSGGFYVLGQTFVDFNPGEGFENVTGNGFSFSLMTMDNVIVESLYEFHVKNATYKIFNWFIYTEESIYVDAVNNRMEINGVFFAAAKGNSGNEIPLEDENGDPIRGIVINAFDGYVTNSGTETRVNNFTSFDFDPMQEASLHDEFLELPEFSMLAVVEGEYTIKRSLIFYNND